MGKNKPPPKAGQGETEMKNIIGWAILIIVLIMIFVGAMVVTFFSSGIILLFIAFGAWLCGLFTIRAVIFAG